MARMGFHTRYCRRSALYGKGVTGWLFCDRNFAICSIKAETANGRNHQHWAHWSNQLVS